MPVDDSYDDDGVEELAGAGPETVGRKKSIPYVNADTDGFAKNFVGAYDTGAPDLSPVLPEPLTLDFGVSEVEGTYGVRSKAQSVWDRPRRSQTPVSHHRTAVGWGCLLCSLRRETSTLSVTLALARASMKVRRRCRRHSVAVMDGHPLAFPDLHHCRKSRLHRRCHWRWYAASASLPMLDYQHVGVLFLNTAPSPIPRA